MNLHRRHLSESQRGMVAAKLANMTQGQRTDLEPSANLQNVTRTDAAALLNVSTRTVAAAANVRLIAERRYGELLAELARAEPKHRAEAANATLGRSSAVGTNVEPRQSDYAAAIERDGRKIAPVEGVRTFAPTRAGANEP